MVVPSARGSPALVLSATALAIAATSFIFDSGTIIRDGALHDCPELLNMCITPPVTALARSASSRMMFGDLPPSSWLTRLTVGAARLATSTPARVEPVNEIMSMSGCSLMAAPTSGPRPLIRLNTPFGTPASCRISAKIKRRGRRELARLQDHGAAGGERGRDLAGDLVQRPVPRRDHADDADGFAQHHRGADTAPRNDSS